MDIYTESMPVICVVCAGWIAAALDVSLVHQQIQGHNKSH